MNRHTLTLFGNGPTDGLRVRASVFNDTLTLFLEGVRRAARYEIEGESVRRGQRPSWLEELCGIDLTGLSAGSAVVAIEAPTFGEIGIGTLLNTHEPLPADQSAVDRFAVVLASMVEGESNDDVLADRALLDVCARLARASSTGFEGLRLDGLRSRREPVVVRAADAARIETLKNRTPPSRAVRLSGRLDTISASRADIVLELENGTRLPARLDAHDPEALGHLFGDQITVSGTVHYRPSGQVHHLRVEAIDRARKTDRLFRTLPATYDLPYVDRVPQDENSGVNAFFGDWPGEETEDELLEALGAIG